MKSYLLENISYNGRPSLIDAITSQLAHLKKYTTKPFILITSAVLLCFVSFSASAGNFKSKIDPRIHDAFSQRAASKGKKIGIENDLLGTNAESIRVIVRLKNDSSATATPRNTAAFKRRGKKVKFAQQEFRNSIKNRVKKGFKTVKDMRMRYAIIGTSDDIESLEELAARDDVSSIEYDKLNKLFTVEGRALVGSDQIAASGFTGEGVGVVVIDSHFDLKHPELGGSSGLPNGVVFDSKNFSDPGTGVFSQEMSECYHGTGTASIVRRYAPDVDLYALTVFPNAYDSTIADAIDWAVENKDGTNGGAPIKIISMSLGGGEYSGTCNSGVIHDAAGVARDNGILVFAASGNNGWTSATASPSCSDNVISVGSVWDASDTNYDPFPPANCSDYDRILNERTCYSNKSPVLDLYAPSEEVMCAKCGGGTMPLGGTSSACPAAAGMTAQLLHAKPELTGDKDLTVALYQSTGVDVIGDSGKKRIDLYAAVSGEYIPPNNELINGVTTNYTLADGENADFTIAIPADTTNLQVSISGGGDLDLYVKDSVISWPGDKGSHDTDTFKSPYSSGSDETVTFPAPAGGTWYVIVNAYSGSSGTVTATWDVVVSDTDGDGILNNIDNCPNDSNADQADNDGDGIGNVCDTTPDGDPDADSDGIIDSVDNCPNDANADQADNDNDGTGNVCDTTPNGPDADGDGIIDTADNCPNDANADQADNDNDGLGNVCDTTPNGPDADGDGITDNTDNCPNNANADQADNDADGIGNVCDATPDGEPDTDNDGIIDSADNCPNNANLDQADNDADGTGNVCDTTPNGPDADGDGIVDTIDNCPNNANADQADNDADGIGNVCDTTPDGDSHTLINGQSVNFSLNKDATTEYTIAIPANAINLNVIMTGSGDLDLYVKNEPINWPSESGSHNTDTFKAPYSSNSDETVTFTAPTEGTWNVLVSAYSSGDATLTATWSIDNGDSDGDGVLDGNDNCPNDANTDQADNDNDGIGNFCDPTPEIGDTFCEVYEDSNTTHVSAGRAYSTGWGIWTEAVGSGDSLGYYLVGSSTLYESPQGYYSVTPCQ